MTPREFYLTPFFTYTSIVAGTGVLIYLLTKKKEKNDYLRILIMSLFLLIILGFEFDLEFTSGIMDFISSKFWYAILSVFTFVWTVVHLLKWNELNPVTKTRTILIGMAGLVFIYLLTK